MINLNHTDVKLHSSCESYEGTIYIACDYHVAKQVCREFCLEGLCVSIQKTDYIYTMGEESGVAIKLINYPRFPKSKDEIRKICKRLAITLIEMTHQGSATIVLSDETLFYSRREQDIN